MLPQKRTSSLIGGKTDLCAKLWPNGEVAIWKARAFKPEPIYQYKPDPSAELKMARLRLRLTDCNLAAALAVLLGLSPLPISDSTLKGNVIEGGNGSVVRAVKGLKGITPYGGRMVRNAAHVLESEFGNARCVFATVTMPNLPIEQMCRIHQNWDKAVENYRLGIRRALKCKGLSGELVTVSEIQVERYKKTGLPCLHLHSVFCGVTGSGKFAISTEDHDDIWLRALNTCLNIPLAKVPTACNLQRVKKSASAYLGKYMSKGVKDIERIIADGFAGWLPKHWWNCTRSLARRVKQQTRCIDEFADWLNSVAELGSKDVWEWHRDVVIDMGDGYMVTMARYGRLNIRQTAEIQAYYNAV